MDGYIKIATEIDTKNFDAEIKYIENQMEEIEYQLKQADMGFEVKDTDKLEAQYSRLSKQLSNLIKKQQDLNKTDLSGIKGKIENIGNGMQQNIKKITRWGLALFGIRSIYGLLSSAASTLSGQNEQLGADIKYIKYALATTLQPIIETLINLAYKLLSYINQIAYAWFGVNLFAKATTQNFDKANTSAKKLKKTLAGFDEVNIIGDNNSDNGGSTPIPGFDLSKIEGEPPKWLQWILDHKDEVIGAIAGLTGAFISFKLLGLDPIEASGVFLLIYGLYNLIKDLIDIFGKVDGSLKDNGTSFEDWGNIIKDVGIIVAGLGLLIFGLPTIIAGVIVTIIGLLMKYWDNIKTWFEDRIQEGKNMFANYWQWIINQINGTENEILKGLWRFIGFVFDIFLLIPDIIYGVVQTVLNFFGDLFNGIKQIFDGILLIFKGDFKNGFINIGKGIVNALISILNLAIGVIASVWNAILGGIEKAGGLFGQKWNLGGAKLTWRIPYLAKGGIVNMPGKGVPVGGAIAGEAGREGVLPLTDSQTMAKLGEEIGKWITLNMNITNEIDGRVLNKRLETIKQSNSFSTNGGM